jgi:eukaryotic-like serine/threonine-protein kinase
LYVPERIGSRIFTVRASKLINSFEIHAASDVPLRNIRLPELLAIIELKRGNSMRALELLAPVKRYEEGWSDGYWAAYLRGQAYLVSRQGQDAVREFQKILDHSGVVLNSLFAALAHVGLARAYILQGDAAKAKAAYQDFLTLWKDPDPDIPILKGATAEHAKLQWSVKSLGFESPRATIFSDHLGKSTGEPHP